MTWDARDYGAEEERPLGIRPHFDPENPDKDESTDTDETPTNQLLRQMLDPMAPPTTWKPARVSPMMRLEMAQAGLVPDGDWARIRRQMTRGILEE